MNRAITFTALGVLVAAGCKNQDETETTAPPAEDSPEQAGADDTAGGQEAEEAESAEPVRVEDAGLDTPESVLHDAEADVYLVSNIGGSPLEKDGNGFISRVTPEGEVEALKWIDGGAEGVTLNAPKGLAISGDTLYVTDIDVVRTFNRETGEPTGEIAIEGSTFLNDLAARDGAVYVSDSGMKAGNEGFAPSGTDGVYMLSEGKAEPLAEGEDLSGPNGLAVADDGVWVVTFRANQLYRLTKAGEKKDVTELPKGGLDGVVRLSGGDVLVSSWEGQAVYRGKPGGEFAGAIADVAAPADVGFDEDRDRVLIPLFEDDAVLLAPLE